MDLSKYIDLLRTRELYLAPASKLSDPFEGSVPPFQSLASLKTLAETPEGKRELEKVLQNGSWNDIAAWLGMVEKMSELGKALPHMTFISCWHMARVESFAMWKLYSNSADSICIRTTYDRLDEALPDNVFLGKVKYDFEMGFSVGNALTRFFKKRSSFAYEQEVRAVFMVTCSPIYPQS